MSTINAPVVTDGEIATFSKRLNELFTRFVTKQVYANPQQVLDGLQRLIEGKSVEVIPTIAGAVAADHIIDFDSTPFTPSGWSVLPDTEQLTNRVRGQLKFDSTKVVLHLDDGQKGRKYTEGNNLRKKLADVPVYGAQLLDFYLAYPHLIPEEWKDKEVFFWGTIYRRSAGGLHVRYLCWVVDRWSWDCHWLDDFGWDSHSPAAVSAS